MRGYRVQIRIPLLLGALAIAASCSDSTSPKGNSGALSFGYAGSASGTGTFNVSGVYPTLAADVGKANAAGAAKNSAGTGFQVAGIRTQANSKFDVVVLNIPSLTVGTSTINAAVCQPTSSDSCPALVYVTGVSQTDQQGTLLCLLGTGNIAITSVTSTRLKGTFTGSGLCSDGTQNPPTDFTVTNGTFDVAIVSTLDGV
jgi:hypothetical protein